VEREIERKFASAVNLIGGGSGDLFPATHWKAASLDAPSLLTAVAAF
jgi:hypothetical protein